MASAGDYIAQAIAQFHRSAAGTAVMRRFRIAGRLVDIYIGGAAMDRHIARGLAHLACTDAGDPAFTIHAWDSAGTDGAFLKPGWSKEAYGYHGLIDGFNDARFHGVLQLDPHILRLIDFQRREAVYWMPTAADLPVWERGAPLRPLLHEWLRHEGLVPVHGGAVGLPGGGVFLAGAGGSGKSNLALSCLTSPLSYASDDFCVLSEQPWTVHSLYCTGKMAAPDRVRHPHLAGQESNPDRLADEKALFFLHPVFADRLIASMPLKAIVMPRVTGRGTSRLLPGGSADAQKAIAMSTIQMSRATAAFTFARVAAFVRALPCYELHIGADPAEARARLIDLVTASP